MSSSVLEEIGPDLPSWLEAVLGRLRFYRRREPDSEFARRLDSLLSKMANQASSTARADTLDRFLRACLASLLDAAHSKPELHAHRADLAVLCGLAREALDTDRYDRPLIFVADGMRTLEEGAPWAIRVPGRVVFLAAMVAAGPEDEIPAAAIRLTNDLAAAVGLDHLIQAVENGLLGN
ncbi:hypothetical protein ACFJIU_21770 [Mesorhizobium sp. UC74_2]|uniref:hypothetical protein n=1 Tax=Mesorhizobium sp. UC74_2 TaxID=3350171 RepID=UPI00366C8EAA